MKRKAICILAALALSMSLFSIPAFAGAGDTADHWASAAVERWSAYGVVQGYEDGTFRPEAGITRAEAAAVLARLLYLQEQTDKTFEDAAQGAWYYDSVSKCVAAGILQGEGALIRPDELVTRQDAVVMLGRALGEEELQKPSADFDDADEIEDYAVGYMNAFADKGYLSGYADGALHPGRPITRAEFLTLLDNMIGTYIAAPGTYTITGDGYVIVNACRVELEKSDFRGRIIETAVVDDEDLVAEAPSGTYVGVREDNGTVSFKGIVFAEAPAFQRAVVAEESSEVIFANEHGPASTSGDPDALNLAIYVNPESGSTEKSVYMYLYGSAQLGGTTSKSSWQNFVEANPDIIVVTPNYRGGFWGSIDLRQLEGYEKYSGQYDVSNNIARLDAIACLQWIQENIAAFGGNPDDVTIGGQSSGSNICTALLYIDEAKPLFQKAILQESYPTDISLQPLESAQYVSADLFERLGVTSMEEFLKKTPGEINAAQKEIQSASMSGSSAYADIEYKLFSPVIDNVVIHEDYYEKLLNGGAEGKTIMLGSNAGGYDQQYAQWEENTGSNWADALQFTINQNWGKLSERGWNAANAQAVIEGFFSNNEEYGRNDWVAAKDLKNDLYIRMSGIILAEAMCRYTDVYYYYFDWDITPENAARAAHGSENEVIQRRWEKVPENMLEGAERLSDMWASFIRSGNPNCSALKTAWTPYNGTTHDTLHITEQPALVCGIRMKDVELLLPLQREYPLLQAALEQ